MTDPERLARLCTELSKKASYATGSRPFPGAVSDDEGEAIAEALAEEMEQGTAARADLAARGGHRIACGPGCTGCCEIMVMIYRPEALRIARHLQRPEGAAARAAFLAAYPAWRAAAADVPERLTALFIAGKGAEYDALHLAQWGRRLPCAFLQGGRCSIYEVRPLGCRNAHALGTSERCRAGSPRPAEALAFVPLDEFLKNATRLLRAAHNAGPEPRHGQRALCAAVHDLLQAPARTPAP